MTRVLIVPLATTILLACNLGDFSLATPTPSPTVLVAKFNTATPTVVRAVDPSPSFGQTDEPTLTPSPTSTPASTATKTVTSTPTSAAEPTPLSEVSPSLVVPPPTDTAVSAGPPAAQPDFVLRYVRMRTNEENSWDGTLGPGNCGSDHSIYVHVADAQESLLDGVLIGDKYGNFEVPTGVDGPGAVRILVWSATMELTVMGHQDGTRYTSDFTPPLSTLDEDIPLDWLEQAGYCESSEDCRWRVDNNQLCRGHYSYDIIFQRTW